MTNARLAKLGFTLIELLVVIAILGILATLGIGAYASSQMKSRDSHRKTDLRNIATVLETYYNDVGAYPLGVSGKIKGCGAGPAVCEWGGGWSKDTNTVYMVTLPDDGSAYDYRYESSDGKSYALYARLENTGDPQVVKNGAAAGAYSSICKGTTVHCNFAVASANAVLNVQADVDEAL